MKWQFAHRKFRVPIAVKLIGLTAGLLFAVTVMIALQSSEYFEKEVRETHEQSNDRQAENRATQVEAILTSYLDKVRVVAALMSKNYTSEDERNEAMQLAFFGDRDLISVEILTLMDNREESTGRIINSKLLAGENQSMDFIETIRQVKPFPTKTIFAGEVVFINSSVPNGIPMLTVGLPFVKDEYDQVSHIAVANIRLERIQKAFSGLQAAEIFLVDQNGAVIAHPDDQYTMNATQLNKNPLVDRVVKSKTRVNQMRSYVNPYDNKSYYGFANRTEYGVSVVAQVPEEIILEPARLIRRKAFHTGGLVLSAALFLIFLFSITITTPIERLHDLTQEIAQGNFDVNAQAQITSRDEVGDLAASFDKMTSGLKALVKTQGADVAQTLMDSDLEKLGGTKKQVAVLFSDLRDFTKFSEGHAPEEVVEMLNEYFEIMVGCIEKNQGRVNKFIGDAIMAMWGAPNSTGNDEVLSVQAALDMRIELNKLNELRISRGQPPIKIGVGLHCGAAVAGTIGSRSRLEYTIIGDAVNQASRIEASTKAFGVDILLSHEIMQKVDLNFSTSYAGSAEVKGKAEPLKFFELVGYKDEAGQVVEVQTPYSRFEAQDADKVKKTAA
ncbi:MAG: adenylate/guanylate cyclase domain-containing protein [Bdellovibrionales bacterium]